MGWPRRGGQVFFFLLGIGSNPFSPGDPDFVLFVAAASTNQGADQEEADKSSSSC
jgi:hypothetical protein